MLKFMYPKEKYISTILLNGRTYARATKYNPIITQDVIKAILNLCTFSSAVRAATLYFSALRVAIHSRSNASVQNCPSQFWQLPPRLPIS